MRASVAIPKCRSTAFKLIASPELVSAQWPAAVCRTIDALLAHFAEKLPVSRLQRDLTDSTVMRNLGVALGHAVLAYQSLAAGLSKVEIDAARLEEDLAGAWEVLGEAIQTVMRAHGLPDAYDRLKDFTRGRPVDAHAMREFIASLALPPEEKKRLLALEPQSYLGLAPALARRGR